MDEREMIKRALGRFCKTTRHYGTANFPIYSERLDIDALDEQAIVIECEVEHRGEGETAYTIVLGPSVGLSLIHI